MSRGDFLATQPHDNACAHLLNFLTAASFDQWDFKSALFEALAGSVGCSFARFVLKLVVAVRDACILAGTFQKLILAPLAEQPLEHPEANLGFATGLLRLLGISIGEVDALATTQKAIDIESSGITILYPLAVVREWLGNMRYFVANSVKVVMGEFMVLLRGATAACQAATPTWTACFNEAEFNIVMAKKMPTGKLGRRRLVASARPLHLAPPELVGQGFVGHPTAPGP